jgi:hypothetical protein
LIPAPTLPFDRMLPAVQPKYAKVFFAAIRCRVHPYDETPLLSKRTEKLFSWAILLEKNNA